MVCQVRGGGVKVQVDLPGRAPSWKGAGGGKVISRGEVEAGKLIKFSHVGMLF